MVRVLLFFAVGAGLPAVFFVGREVLAFFRHKRNDHAILVGHTWDANQAALAAQVAAKNIWEATESGNVQCLLQCLQEDPHSASAEHPAWLLAPVMIAAQAHALSVAQDTRIAQCITLLVDHAFLGAKDAAGNNAMHYIAEQPQPEFAFARARVLLRHAPHLLTMPNYLSQLPMDVAWDARMRRLFASARRHDALTP